jgi:hypothetical protein
VDFISSLSAHYRDELAEYGERDSKKLSQCPGLSFAREWKCRQRGVLVLKGVMENFLSHEKLFAHLQLMVIS